MQLNLKPVRLSSVWLPLRLQLEHLTSVWEAMVG
jgi:hypothetical protein